jgi:hypothetical protein
MAEIIDFKPALDLHQQRVRMNELLRRHVRAEDKALSDAEFALAMFNRWRQAREDYIIDPNE